MPQDEADLVENSVVVTVVGFVVLKVHGCGEAMSRADSRSGVES